MDTTSILLCGGKRDTLYSSSDVVILTTLQGVSYLIDVDNMLSSGTALKAQNLINPSDTEVLSYSDINGHIDDDSIHVSHTQEMTAWQPVTTGAGFTARAGFNPPEIYKDSITNVVYLRGVVDFSVLPVVWQPVVNIPTGFRPSSPMLFSCFPLSGRVLLRVMPTGYMDIYNILNVSVPGYFEINAVYPVL
jgi:hypothetical protein